MTCRTQKLYNKTVCLSESVPSSQTISTAGNYCLAQNTTGTITITASDVMLDLNNYTLTGTVVVNSNLNHIKIRNGVVNGSGNNGITINSGVTNLTIDEVTVKDSAVGIQFNTVQESTINRCKLLSNECGIEFSSADYNVIQDTIAYSNTQRAFSLISSTGNCIADCKAFNTGFGNTTAFNNNVFSFVSDSGTENIFERCIANATQALSTTDQDSTVAGFALLGTGEQCNKIIECEAAHATTSSEGVTVPHGILLQSTLGSVEQLAAYTIVTNDVAWSPDRFYVAICGGSFLLPIVQVFDFDFQNNELVRIAVSGTPPNLQSTSALSWSMGGNYIVATLPGNTLFVFEGTMRIYQFDPINNTLKQVALQSFGVVNYVFNSIQWSLDDNYIALAGAFGGGLRIYTFDKANHELASVVSALTGSTINSVTWSPDGNYIAVGGASGLPDRFAVYRFDQEDGTLTLQDSAITSGEVNAVDWSAGGDYIAVGGTMTPGLQVYAFNRATGLLESAGSLSVGTVSSAVWSPDDTYIAIGTQLYTFDKSMRTLTLAAAGTVGFLANAWSPDGQYIAAVLLNTNVQIWSALEFPSKNIIKDNMVYCNSNGTYGTGISGSSIENLIIQNTAYNNSFNYVFVQNEFNQFFQTLPNDLQNIGYAGCEVVTIPYDCEAGAKGVEIFTQSAIDLL